MLILYEGLPYTQSVNQFLRVNKATRWGRGFSRVIFERRVAETVPAINTIRWREPVN
ncbi:MAG TPA: hypothetical protein VK040_02000 [Balneolaceae bacterium]|nr:hypothetical protein [Balneolaceae bacterium]